MDLKLSINDGPKSYKKVLPENEAMTLIGMRLGATIKGDLIGLPGYELLIKGGSDKCGFPMIKGVKSAERAKILKKGYRKTCVGNTISENIVQLNLKVINKGKKSLEELFTTTSEEKQE